MPNTPNRPNVQIGNKIRRTLAIMLSGVAAALLVSCASTNITNSWIDPSVRATPFHFKTVAVAVLSKNPSLRRSAEDALAASFTRVSATPAYTLIPDSEMGDFDKIKDRLRDEAIDGVVIMHLVGVDKELTWVPETYPAFRGYWGRAYPMAYDPGYLRTDTIVRVETNIYSVGDGKLLYSALSKTFNPTDADKTVREIAKSIADDLKQRGLML